MSLKFYKPVTPSTRGLVTIDRSHLWKGDPEKSLVVGLNKTGGRNNLGRITSRHIGGGAKRKYRIIDFIRNKDGVNATVERIEYDPNRTAFIALIKYEDGVLSYILAPNKLAVGDVVSSGVNAELKVGNCLPLSLVPIGSFVHNIEMKAGKGGQIARSAGSFARIMAKSKGYAQIEMRSKEIRLLPLDAKATLGVVSNADNKNINYGKAGRS